MYTGPPVGCLILLFHTTNTVCKPTPCTQPTKAQISECIFPNFNYLNDFPLDIRFFENIVFYFTYNMT